MTENILEVKDLCVSFNNKANLFSKGGEGKTHAVKNVSLCIKRNEIHGLVGESGSGKSTLGRSIMGLAPVTSGEILFHSRDGQAIDLVKDRGRSLNIQIGLFSALKKAWLLLQQAHCPLHMFLRHRNNHPVILLHTTSQDNARILSAFIDYAISQGYTFRSLDDYPGWEK